MSFVMRPEISRRFSRGLLDTSQPYPATAACDKIQSVNSRGPMNVVIRVSDSDRARTWGFPVRYSPGTALPNNTFIVSEAAARGLRDAGINFDEIRKVSHRSGRPVRSYLRSTLP